MTPDEVKKRLRQKQEQRYREQTIAQINEKIESLRALALKNVDKALQSGGIPDQWKEMEENHLLSNAIIDGICRDRPYKPKAPQTIEEFDNLYLFL